MANTSNSEGPDGLNGKFQDPVYTDTGAVRAQVPLIGGLETLWVNTGTLCNITCAHCYIESSPTNDRLAYFRLADLTKYLDEIADLGLKTTEIGFTGGEPFMNPDMLAMLDLVLARGFRALVLTNAMLPMAHKKPGLKQLRDLYGNQLVIRVSLDHYTAKHHEEERGPNSWAPTLSGLKWLADEGFCTHIAGRTLWGEEDGPMRKNYEQVLSGAGIQIDCADPQCLVLFPEIAPAQQESQSIPEITESCWKILNKNPADIMCASSRMVVLRKGDVAPRVLACTLIPYDDGFDLGPSLAESLGQIALNHPHCAQFCVLGGGACS
jgi:uncharacterized Fe-S cluster-containing radical SAM superfamily protein